MILKECIVNNYGDLLILASPLFFSDLCMVCGIMTTYFEIKEVDVMSVIMAYKTDDKIYLGADNRTVSVAETIHKDNVSKISVINDNVAIAFAGCNKFQMVFEFLLKYEKDITKLRVEDILRLNKKTYRFCKILWFRKFSKEILSLGSQIIVTGKNRKDEGCLYIAAISNRKFIKPLKKEWFIFPPYGIDMERGCNIYCENIKKYPNNFIQKTIKDISKINKYVSSSGDIWTYDIHNGESILKHFK